MFKLASKKHLGNTLLLAQARIYLEKRLATRPRNVVSSFDEQVLRADA